MKAIALIIAMLLSTSSFRDVLAAENVEVRTLSAKDFSKYAANLCKRLKISGPTQITSLAHRQSLLTTLNRLQLDKVLQLENVGIKEDAKAKAKIQSELDVIVKEIQSFPNLQYNQVEGYVKPSWENPDRTRETAPTQKKFHVELIPEPEGLLMYDPISVVREQIRLKHGKYYAGPQ